VNGLSDAPVSPLSEARVLQLGQGHEAHDGIAFHQVCERIATVSCLQRKEGRKEEKLVCHWKDGVLMS